MSVVEVFLESEVSPPSGTLERVSGIWDLGNLGGSLLRYDGGPEESELELPFEPACIPTGETSLALDGKLLMDIMLLLCLKPYVVLVEGPQEGKI